jgi:hypothetical protein
LNEKVLATLELEKDRVLVFELKTTDETFEPAKVD